MASAACSGQRGLQQRLHRKRVCNQDVGGYLSDDWQMASYQLDPGLCCGAARAGRRRPDREVPHFNRHAPVVFSDQTGGLRMSVQSHLAELERRHQTLEIELRDALLHPSVDNLTVAELKRRKLLLKDEISRLRSSMTVH
jgi:hypothetical protein